MYIKAPCNISIYQLYRVTAHEDTFIGMCIHIESTRRNELGENIQEMKMNGNWLEWPNSVKVCFSDILKETYYWLQLNIQGSYHMLRDCT